MRLSARIIELIPPHRLYLEPFCGAAWVFFRKKPSYAEVLNDYNGDIINFYEQLRDNLPELLSRCRYLLKSRACYEKYKREDLSTLPPVERAFRFWYLLKHSFGGRLVTATKIQSRSRRPIRYKCSFARGGIYENRHRFNLDLAECAFWHERLAGVCLENLDWRRFMELYDHPDAFFYIDPPYYGSETCYGPIFCRGEYQDMAEVLKGLKGKFLLSLNDRPEVRGIFQEFHIRETSAIYSVSRRACKVNPELFIMNY